MFMTQKQAKESGNGRRKKRLPYREVQAANNLRDALMEVAPLKQCNRHPRRVWYEEQECPACVAENQFLSLADEKV
jgi:hypothetical protein